MSGNLTDDRRDGGPTVDEPPLPPLGSVGLLRWMWRQLTSMRTALILLFLLALASIPGSVLPQRGTNPLRVDQWLADNPSSGPVAGSVRLLRRVLLAVVRGGVPAAVHLAHRLRPATVAASTGGPCYAPPPPAPRRSRRLPVSTEFESTGSRRRRPRSRPATHLAPQPLAGARGDPRANGGDGSRGSRPRRATCARPATWSSTWRSSSCSSVSPWAACSAGRATSSSARAHGFSNTLTQYDAWGGGRFVSPDALAPFSFTLDTFTVDFEREEAQRGHPACSRPTSPTAASPADAGVAARSRSTSPCSVDGAKVFLVGHGYAPHFVVTDSTGATVFDDTVVFLPQDGNFTSTGVVKIPDATPALGLNGLFLPTATLDDVLGPISTFPGPDYPAVFLSAFKGDLGLDAGTPQSVYRLDTTSMEKIGLESLLPGETWTLPDGSGQVEFTGFERWASFQIAYDPGKELALVAAVAAMAGLLLSLFVRRRRIWVKVVPAAGGGTLVQVAGPGEDGGRTCPTRWRPWCRPARGPTGPHERRGTHDDEHRSSRRRATRRSTPRWSR